MPSYIPIIGLEIHVELKTKSKMFCRCANNPFVATPNTNICEICLAHPGTLPVPNRSAIVDTVKIARALGCTINAESKFDRKHYFYPDLPKAYQISQYDQPIGEHGEIVLTFNHAQEKNQRDNATIGITRVHLEEDTAKLTHAVSHPERSEGSPRQRRDSSATPQKDSDVGNTLVDFNRAGVPLVEIVSEPDVESALEAKTYCQELQLIFRYLGVSDADMEKGQMRCEANVSLQEAGRFTKERGTLAPKAGYKLNPKVEVKNINSFRAVEKAIEFEVKRQTALLGKGETWQQETRGWDEGTQATVHQRFKETSADYRYFPEPDIPPFEPLKIASAVSIGELPLARRERFHQEYGFSYADSYLLTAEPAWAEYVENVMSELTAWLHALPETHACVEKDKNTDKPPLCKTAQDLARLAGGWLTSKLMGAMKERAIDIKILKVKPENFAELVALIYANRVNSTNAQKILAEMLDSGVNLDPTHIMEEKGYGQISDTGKIGAIVDDIIKNYPKQIAEFKAGKEPLIKFLIGMAMKASEGSADPQVVEKMLREKMK
ncbi:MAG: Asp-tRNA(Asn)/Glu-tRNA(Gln) amidotransferase subunit GatB [Candidatus Magasanikbacteria bacterium]|nr:Asp-tRNA(Asn)/Glu-tRNA(Gln) amidotransferase subunit GatB [Candidatus Magasanikbacteria bacterium]